MIDESKHTEDAELSRYEYADTHSFQDTNRNLKRISDIANNVSTD